MEIYLDNCATTKVCDAAMDACVRAMQQDYGNPSSLHRKGLDAENIVTAARKSVARWLNCEPGCITFTSGATESNNLAIFGSVAARSRAGKTIVTTAIEHPSVAEPIGELERRGYTVKRIAPKPDGNFDPDELIDAVDADTVLFSMMMVNNEVGTVSPYQQVIPVLRKKFPKLLIHMDGVQGFCKLPLNLKKIDLDLFSFSGHKLYAPKGVGGLYIKKGLRILPTVFGGGQEQGLRSGTESVPLIAALGAALDDYRANERAINDNYRACNAHLRELLNGVENVIIHSPIDGAPHLINCSLPGVPSEILLHTLEQQEIYVSSGSACAKGQDSSVLAAYGIPQNELKSAVRISFSKDTTCEQLDIFAEALKTAAEKIRKVTR